MGVLIEVFSYLCKHHSRCQYTQSFPGSSSFSSQCQNKVPKQHCIQQTLSATRLSQKLHFQLPNIKRMRDRQLRAMAPKPLLTNTVCPKKYPSRISNLRVDYSHKQQSCVQAFTFTRQFFVSQTFHAKKKGKSQLCI